MLLGAQPKPLQCCAYPSHPPINLTDIVGGTSSPSHLIPSHLRYLTQCSKPPTRRKISYARSPVNTRLCQSSHPITSTPETPITVIHAVNGLWKIRRQRGRGVGGSIAARGGRGEHRCVSVSLQALRGFDFEGDQYVALPD